MLETQALVERKIVEARSLDRMLIEDRKPAIGRNLLQIEGRKHSTHYVERLAGISDETYRKSRSEAQLEWFAAVAIEDPERAGLVSDFWQPLFQYAGNIGTGLPFLPRSFWELDADITVTFSALRQAVLKGEELEAKFHIAQVKWKLEEMLRGLEIVGMQR